MPWKIQSVVGERWRLIQTLLQKKESVKKLCRIFGVSRKTIYKWKRRFIEGGKRALHDRLRQPRRIPHRLGSKWVERIRRLRKQRPHWGPKKLRAEFGREGWKPPTERTIARWLKRLGLTHAVRRRPRKACVRLLAAQTAARRPNHVWTVDFKGWFRSGNGQRCEPLTVRDLFSRYGLLSRLLPTQHWKPVQAAFARLFRDKGLPEIIRVDNGVPFASRGPGGLSRLSAWWVRLGIRVEFTRPARPQDNGSHEQFHRVMKKETTGPVAWTRGGQQHRTTVWLRDYNRHRPHESLGQKRPTGLYRKSRRRFSGHYPEIKYRANDQLRQVRSNGEIRWAGRKRFVGEAFVGQQVALRRLRRGVWSVYFANILIGHLHEQDSGAMRPVLYKHPPRIAKKSKVSPMSCH
jgi:transposase InsO family protein